MNMKFAVVQTGGKQYKVSEGTVLEVEKLEALSGNAFVFDKVLLYAADSDVKVGQPHLAGAKVVSKVLEHKRGKKIRVAKFKAKARHRRVQGHRQELTKVVVESIAFEDKK